MGLEQVFEDDHRQILKVELPAGSGMPEHYATSDAFVIVVEGKAKLIFNDMTCELVRGGTFLIPEEKSHRLEVIDDFKAFIVLTPKAGIEIIDRKQPSLEQQLA